MSAPKLSVQSIEAFERPVHLRLPFRFGRATLRHAPQAFVRAFIALEGGVSSAGWSAELMVPKWFDKNPKLSNEQNFDQLRQSLAIASALTLADKTPATAFARHASIEAEHHTKCAEEGLNDLVAAFGLALVDRAIIDALGRATGKSVFALVKENALGVAAPADLPGFDMDAFLQSLSPAETIGARHTVGLIDPLRGVEIADEDRLDDGLPQALDEIVAAYGHTDFKLKVGGDVAADVDRLTEIATVLDATGKPYRATLDGNEQYESADEARALWDAMAGAPKLQKLCASILFIEQPIARSAALSVPVDALAAAKPVEIDESGGAPDAFITAKSLGYTGISSKSCKGFYKSLANCARMTAWNAAADGARYFMSAEDLTTQAGVALQQDLALATLIGCDHVERNGHHYVDGFVGSGASADEANAFKAAHPDLYARTAGGVRLIIKDGRISLRSLDAPGLASAAMPDWSTMTPIALNTDGVF
ncbi:MAG: enolase C-terminal domain-like protein [Pseudomonadota bacterium]